MPADGASEQREVEALRRELEAAQRQGEAYARELAAVFSFTQPAPPRFSSKPAEINLTLSALTAMSSGMGAQLRNIFSNLERELSAIREGKGAPAASSETFAQQMALGSELVADLVRLAQCPVYESMQHVNLADSVRAAMGELESRATRRGVVLKSRIPPHVDIESRPSTTTLLARTLINDAILATPKGHEVTVTVEALKKVLGSWSKTVAPPSPKTPSMGWYRRSSTPPPSVAPRPSRSTAPIRWRATSLRSSSWRATENRRPPPARVGGWRRGSGTL